MSQHLKILWHHQHQCATCWDIATKAWMELYFSKKNVLPSILFSLDVLLLSQRIQKCNKKWTNLFSPSHHLVCSTHEESPKMGITKNYNVVGILQHFGLSSTCPYYVDSIYNCGSIGNHQCSKNLNDIVHAFTLRIDAILWIP